MSNTNRWFLFPDDNCIFFDERDYYRRRGWRSEIENYIAHSFYDLVVVGSCYHPLSGRVYLLEKVEKGARCSEVSTRNLWHMAFKGLRYLPLNTTCLRIPDILSNVVNKSIVSSNWQRQYSKINIYHHGQLKEKIAIWFEELMKNVQTDIHTMGKTWFFMH